MKLIDRLDLEEYQNEQEENDESNKEDNLMSEKDPKLDWEAKYERMAKIALELKQEREEKVIENEEEEFYDNFESESQREEYLEGYRSFRRHIEFIIESHEEMKAIRRKYYFFDKLIFDEELDLSYLYETASNDEKNQTVNFENDMKILEFKEENRQASTKRAKSVRKRFRRYLESSKVLRKIKKFLKKFFLL